MERRKAITASWEERHRSMHVRSFIVVKMVKVENSSRRTHEVRLNWIVTVRNWK